MTQSVLATIDTATLRAILVDMRAKRDHVAARLIDTELFYRQPVVTHDTGYGEWHATRGDFDLGCTVGYGRTEADAIADLVDHEEDIRANGGCEPDAVSDDYGMAEERARHP